MIIFAFLKIFIIATLIFASQAFSAPSSITASWSGNLTHGTTVTITGAGFGTKSPVAPQVFDNGANWGSWTNNGYTQDTDSGDQRHTNVSANYYHSDTSRSDLEYAFGTEDRSGGAPVYAVWWFRPEATLVDPNKFSRCSSTGSFLIASTISWVPGHIYSYNADTSTYCSNTYTSTGTVTNNQWNMMELLIDAQASTAFLTVRANQKGGTTTWSASCTNNKDLRKLLIGANGTGVANHLSEPYVDLTFQRVYACNNATFASATHCEVQIPQNTWGDTSLEISFNQGSFANEDEIYFLVWDSSNDYGASALYAVNGTSGGGSSPSFGSFGGGLY